MKKKITPDKHIMQSNPQTSKRRPSEKKKDSLEDWITSVTNQTASPMFYSFISLAALPTTTTPMLFSPKLFSQVKQQISTDQVTSIHKGADWLCLYNNTIITVERFFGHRRRPSSIVI